MAKVKGDVVIDIEICKGCELCIGVCPTQILEQGKHVNNKGYQYIIKAKDNCTGCQSCALMCPDAAITVYRKINKN